ncbi:heat shock protein DnaJ domain protein [Stanieria cyanosphaera PCC 7437]|uniref:Heat shock protein DnaJ domain protein n=1 Tax=Stanieria cyanosphaera (strain ATCC 29371 / PCC 7437) TaxID=111780 RepID=K9XUT2_STAC7|nr:CPP1-like family protein [Stanieria cyanosphaera]AFZ35819.1 heat shock protein DnaJ domain protein [Stanieria cyanosphaera PCC 7437]
MNEQNPYEQLNVTENASFEEIQNAKRKLKEQYSQDTKVLESIEAAYDAIIMDRLRLRQEGKIKVPERIRFPERLVETPSDFTPVTQKNSPQWLKNLLDRPSQAEILWPTGIYIVLAATAVFAQSTEASLLPLLMALGFMANIYFLNRKENKFPRSLLISLVVLLVGIGLGNGLAQLLLSQTGGIGLNVEQFASVLTFCLFWIASCFLR